MMVCSFQRIGLPQCTLFAVSLASMLMLAGCTKPTESTKTEDGKSAAAKAAKDGDQAAKAGDTKKLKTGRAVLEAMAAAYRNAKTYQDRGTIRVSIKGQGEEPKNSSEDFSVTFQRPNKLAMNVYAATVRCDGQKFRATLQDLPGQVLERDAPEKLELKNLSIDRGIDRLLSQNLHIGPAGSTPQPVLLLDDNAIDDLFKGAKEPILSQPGEIDKHPCYIVKVSDPYGLTSYWIDQKTLALRQIMLPTDALRSEYQQRTGRQVESISVIADFMGAEFDREIDPKVFTMEPSAGESQTVRYFIPPHPGQWMAKKVPDFKFTDLAGKTVTPESFAGKVTAIAFWSGWMPDSEQRLLDLQKIFDAYKDNDKVAVCTVCTDDNADPKALENYCRSIKITMPLYRNLEPTDPGLRNSAIPTLVYLMGADGVMQDFASSPKPDLSSIVPEKIDALLAGKNLSEQAIERYQKEMDAYEKEMDSLASGKGPVMAQPKIAPPSEPKTIKLKSLWKCGDLKDPWNVLVVNDPKKPRLLVVNPPDQVAEMGLDGKIIAFHKFNLAGGEVISNLRSFTTAAGKTYVVAFASDQQRLHLFNLQDQQGFTYPEDALKNRHSGIADVELCDLDGNGKPEIYVGFWGVVGVHCVGLDGKQVWVNRKMANVARMVAGPADKSGRRDLLCLNIIDEQNSSLFVLNAEGREQELSLGGQENSINKKGLRFIQGADLGGNGKLLWCALSVANEKELSALGFNLQGQALWNFRLPSEPQPRPIEPIIAGRIARDGPGEWILPCPDGSIQILAADGKPIDSFNYGNILGGMATVEIDGKPAIVIASPGSVEAFAVE